MRSSIAAFVLLLAACAPPAPSEAPAPTAENPALSAEPLPGQWSFNADAGTISAGFGAPESEYLFLVVCNAPTGRVTLSYEHELSPDQDTTLTLVTASGSHDFPARSFNEGLPSVNAEVEAGDARLAALAASQESFSVTVAGETSVLPWDASIAEALSSCAG